MRYLYVKNALKKMIVLLYFALALFSCKTVDENRIYKTITPELIEIIDKFEPDKSYSSVFIRNYKNWHDSSMLLVELGDKKTPSIDKIIQMNYNVVILSLPFESKHKYTIDSFMNANRVMALSEKDFYSWLDLAKSFSARLNKLGIKVFLAANLDVIRFNYRMNIPLFYSENYSKLTDSGKDNFKEYLIVFHKYLIEKLKLSGILLQNTNFLTRIYLKKYLKEIKSFAGKGFFTGIFSKGDNYVNERLLSYGFDAILDYNYSVLLAKTINDDYSFAKLSRFLGIDSLYKFPKKHLIFYSGQNTNEKEKANPLDGAVYVNTMQRTGVFHADASFFEKNNTLISWINVFKKRYLKNPVVIELFKNDKVYCYLLTTGKNELLIIINKSRVKFNKVLYLQINKKIPADYRFKDFLGGPDIDATTGKTKITVNPHTTKAYSYKGKKVFRDLKRINKIAISYSEEEKDIKIIRFRYYPNKKVDTVHLVGDFNNWNRTSLPMIDKNHNGWYVVDVPLPPGKYTYKILIDRKYLVADYKASLFIDDGNRGKKSVIIVK